MRARGEQLLDPAVLASIGRLNLITRTVVEGFLIGLHRSPFRGFSQEFAEHRQYMPGDDIRRIDWRVYGRTDRLFVKEFEEETNAPVRIVLDATASMAYAPRDVSKFSYAKFLAASLAYLANRQGDQFGVATIGGVAEQRTEVHGGDRHLHAVLSALERTEPNGTESVAAGLMREAQRWRRRSIAIVVTDLYDDTGTFAETVARVRRVGHDVIVFHLLDLTERTLDFDEAVEFRDLETGRVVIADAPRIRRAYAERIREVTRVCRRELERCGATYELADTAEPLDRALLMFLRKRKEFVARQRGPFRV